MEPIVVEATRDGVVEARHCVHAVAVSGGAIVASAGDPSLVAYFRSSAKPIQALPVVRARPDLVEAEIAIACASHLARPEQLECVRSLLARAPATEDELECGPEPTRVEHNCSGKHAGLLALCRAMGWPTEGYRLPDHPCQQALEPVRAGAARTRQRLPPQHCQARPFPRGFERGSVGGPHQLLQRRHECVQRARSLHAREFTPRRTA